MPRYQGSNLLPRTRSLLWSCRGILFSEADELAELTLCVRFKKTGSRQGSHTGTIHDVGKRCAVIFVLCFIVIVHVQIYHMSNSPHTWKIFQKSRKFHKSTISHMSKKSACGNMMTNHYFLRRRLELGGTVTVTIGRYKRSHEHFSYLMFFLRVSLAPSQKKHF